MAIPASWLGVVGAAIPATQASRLDTLRAAYGREGSVSSVRVRLDSPAAFDLFKASMEGEKQYGYLAMRDAEYLEAVVLALSGGIVGAIASMAMGFVHFSMMNFTSWSEIVFGFEPTPSIIGTSLGLSVAMGLIGGFFPAIRAARVSPIAAMRA